MFKCLLTMTLFLSTSYVFAGGGFEKPSPFSAEGSRLGSALESSASGTNALYYNPAGLSKGPNSVTLDVAALGGYMVGAPFKTGEIQHSDANPVMVPAVIGKYQVNDKLGLGLGYYGFAGIASIYHDLSFNQYDADFGSYKTDNYSKLNVSELSVGAGYQLTSNVSIGLAVRDVIASGSMKTSSVGLASGLTGYGIADDTVLLGSTTNIDKLSGSKFGGIKLGAQYENDEKDWGVGVTYRSSVSIKATGNASGDLIYTTTGSNLTNALTGVTPNVGQVYKLTSSGSSFSTTIPEQYGLGGHIQKGDNKFLFGYTLTKYSKVDAFKMTGTLENALTGESYPITDIQTKWKDMHEFKLGAAHKVDPTLELSAGFTYATGVTNPDYSSAAFSPIDSVKQLDVGLGKSIIVMGKKINMNATVEYQWGNGNGHSLETVSSNVKNPSVSSKTETRSYSGIVGIGIEF